MKIVSILLIFFLLNVINAKLTFPMVYKWSKRSKSLNGCIDPTEPFQCPGSNICISLQFICDGHPGDCPDDYDEDQSLCVAGIHSFIAKNYFITVYFSTSSSKRHNT